MDVKVIFNLNTESAMTRKDYISPGSMTVRFEDGKIIKVMFASYDNIFVGDVIYVMGSGLRRTVLLDFMNELRTSKVESVTELNIFEGAETDLVIKSIENMIFTIFDQDKKENYEVSSAVPISVRVRRIEDSE